MDIVVRKLGSLPSASRTGQRVVQESCVSLAFRTFAGPGCRSGGGNDLGRVQSILVQVFAPVCSLFRVVCGRLELLGPVWTRLELFGAVWSRLRPFAAVCGPSARSVASAGRETLRFHLLLGLSLVPGAAAAAETTWGASGALLCRCLHPFVHFSASFAVACAHPNPFGAVCGVVS